MAHNKVYGFCESGCKVEVDPAGKVKPVSEGGTGATDAEQARKNIGAASETHKHSADDIGGGTIPIANGGTGGSTAREAEYNICKDIEEVATLSDNNLFVFKRQGSMNATNGAFCTKTVSSIWNYIAQKIRSTFGFSSGGVLPIANGGTGATSAANARAALGITPANIGAATSGHTHTAEAIGAVKKSGDTMTGTYTTTGVIAAGWSNARRAGMQSSDIQAYFTSRNTDGTVMNAIYLKDNVTSLGKPLEVASGGTGGTNPNDACYNLGAFRNTTTSDAYYMNGGSGTNSAWVSYLKNGSALNQMDLWHSHTSFKQPVNIASGGTGATTAAAALKNLGLEIQTGTVNDVNSTGVTVTFKTEFSGVPVVVATGSSEQSSVQVKNVTKTGFKIESPLPNNDGCQWIAIYKA